MNLFATTLLRGAWRLVKVIAATALSTVMAHMLIVPMFIEPAINFASRTPSKLLYGGMASCFGAFMILIMLNTLLFESVEIDGYPRWSGWTVLSMLFSSVEIFATRRETESVSSVLLSISLVLLSGFVLFHVIDDTKRQRSQERSVDNFRDQGALPGQS